MLVSLGMSVVSNVGYIISLIDTIVSLVITIVTVVGNIVSIIRKIVSIVRTAVSIIKTVTVGRRRTIVSGQTRQKPNTNIFNQNIKKEIKTLKKQKLDIRYNYLDNWKHNNCDN